MTRGIDTTYGCNLIQEGERTLHIQFYSPQRLQESPKRSRVVGFDRRVQVVNLPTLLQDRAALIERLKKARLVPEALEPVSYRVVLGSYLDGDWGKSMREGKEPKWSKQFSCKIDLRTKKAKCKWQEVFQRRRPDLGVYEVSDLDIEGMGESLDQQLSFFVRASIESKPNEKRLRCYLPVTDGFPSECVVDVEKCFAVAIRKGRVVVMVPEEEPLSRLEVLISSVTQQTMTSKASLQDQVDGLLQRMIAESFLEKRVREYADTAERIRGLEERRKTLGQQILAQTPLRETVFGDLKVTRVEMVRVETSLKDALGMEATQTLLVPDKVKLERFFREGKAVPGVKKTESIRVQRLQRITSSATELLDRES